MDPLILLAIGMLVVVGSILFFKLNAFLALFLGALIVAWLTPESNIVQYAASVNLSPEQTNDLLQQSTAKRLTPKPRS